MFNKWSRQIKWIWILDLVCKTSVFFLYFFFFFFKSIILHIEVDIIPKEQEIIHEMEDDMH